MNSSEHELIAHQNIGDEFSGTYYVESCYIKQTVTNKDYTDMMLRDKSGSRPVKYWGTVKDLKKGCWIYIAAGVQEYMGAPSIVAANVEIEDEPADISDYMPVFENAEVLADDFDELKHQLDLSCDGGFPFQLVEEVYSRGKFFDNFIKCPGSEGLHYGKQGGLLASVVGIGKHCDSAARVLYNLSDFETSVLLASALLCKVGYADAYGFEDCLPAMNKPGILLGVHNLTLTRIQSAMKRIPAEDRDNESVLRILHAVTSSHTNCGVEPMTVEAMLLHRIVEMDNEVGDALDFIADDENDDEFTAYDTNTRRKYYKGV